VLLQPAKSYPGLRGKNRFRPILQVSSNTYADEERSLGDFAQEGSLWLLKRLESTRRAKGVAAFVQQGFFMNEHGSKLLTTARGLTKPAAPW